MEQIEMPSMDQNWKYAVGFVIGIVVTLIIIVVLANKYGKSCDTPAPPLATAASVPSLSSTPAAPPPSEPQLALPSTVVPEAPDGAGDETYMPAPF
jgi:hypothetical protein